MVHRQQLGDRVTGYEDERTDLAAYWSTAPERLLTDLRSSPNGLSQDDAERRLKQFGPNSIKAGRQSSALWLLLSQFKSPLVLILVFAAISQCRLETNSAILALSPRWTAIRTVPSSRLDADASPRPKHPPDMAEWVDHPAAPVTIELISHRDKKFGASSDCALGHLVYVIHEEMDVARRAG